MLYTETGQKKYAKMFTLKIKITGIVKVFMASMVTESKEIKQTTKDHEVAMSLQSLFYKDVLPRTRKLNPIRAEWPMERLSPVSVVLSG